MTSLFDPVSFDHGPAMKNRFMLAPLTNQQSHPDGTLSHDEQRWLTMRAEGGFGLTMTCAAYVQRVGQGFGGQLGCFGNVHLDGLSRLSRALHAEDTLAIMQLHHAGRRSPADLIGEAPVCPSDDPGTGARALATEEVEQLVEDFVAAARRCEQAGFDGVELHGAHDYVICQFLSPETNRRTDRFGGSLENRSRVLFDIIDGIRATCRPDFNLSVRLSPERFGLLTSEIEQVFVRLADTHQVDFIDMSLWDVFKTGIDAGYESRRLVDVFASLPRGSTRLAVAGKLYGAQDCHNALDAGADMAVIGRGAVLHHDFPNQVAKDDQFVVRQLPVPKAVLRAEGLSDAFIGYMSNWKGFVGD